MKAKRFITAVASVACYACMMFGQSAVDAQNDSLIADHRVYRFKDNGVERVLNYSPEIRDKFINFIYDQFRNSQDPEAPFFIFMSKNDDMMMGLGGVVRMRGWYDWGGAMPTNGFYPITIQMPPDLTTMRHLGTTPAGTCLYFRMVGQSKVLGNYQVYIEANFNGYDARGFQLKKAYATIRDFTVGYAASTFSDPAAVPPTIDAAGPNNKMSATNVLVRWMPHISTRWIAAVSLESPDMKIDADGTTTKACSQYLPDASAFVQYEWNRGQHVRLSAITIGLPYRDMSAGRNHTVAGWGVQLSSVWHPAYPLTLYLTANGGKGYAGLGGDLLVGAYDLLNDPTEPGKMYAPGSMGWCVGVQYNFRPNLFMTLIGSQNRLYPDRQISPDEYKYGLTGMANVLWNPVPRVQVGIEFDYGKRQNFSRDHRYARRIGIMGQVSF